MLTDKAIQEFREIYKKEHGIELSNDEARDAAERLISFFELLHKIDRGEEVTKKRKPKKS
ncbi:hypothetical protein KKE34_02160 [Patescibacteria group bacterium]|nr:hypothetical protein [Patescibacteria group bacterium]MBU1885390.1 hypothetical protein [Patescibacteria group bacterium]